MLTCGCRYDLLLSCWHYSPSERPDFSEIVRRFEQILAEASQAEQPQQDVSLAGNSSCFSSLQRHKFTRVLANIILHRTEKTKQGCKKQAVKV